MIKEREAPVLEAKDLKTHFSIRGGIFSREIGKVRAVDGVSLKIYRGETLGLVGESGCGKSTLGRTLLRLVEKSDGEIFFENKEISELPSKNLKGMRRNFQMIFQDPFSSLDPRMSVEKIITEPMKIHNIGDRGERKKRAVELLRLVGLREEDLEKYPHEFSGGQRQRIGIARAISLNPKVIVADEPIAALDVSIQAQILNLLSDLKKRLNLTYLFISHDLSVVRYFSDRVAVMYLGRIVEMTTAEKIYESPIHPYTRALMSSILNVDPGQNTEVEVLQGDVPSPVNPPSGCSFHPRCKFAMDICSEKMPELRTINDKADESRAAHRVSCHFSEDFFRKFYQRF